MTEKRIIGFDSWPHHLDVWVTTPLAVGASFDSLAGEHCWSERIRPLVERLDREFVRSGAVGQYIIVENRVMLYTERNDRELRQRLVKVITEFLGWTDGYHYNALDDRDMTS